MAETQVMIINWNSGNDTIECISSIISFENINILLLDNGSEDDSVATIQKYLDDNFIDHKTVLLSDLREKDIPVKVLLAKSQDNLGFGRGNNTLLDFVMKFRASSKYAWLLNNDTSADKNALKEMILKMGESEKTAFIGSIILDYEKRTTIQSCGVKYYKYFGVSKLILKDGDWGAIDRATIPFNEIDFQHGASLLVRLSAINKIKLMDERFFLYFEEQDWQYVAKESGYENSLAVNSIIYHKGSVATNNKKYLFFYYYNKSAVLFLRKHCPVFVSLFATLMLSGITLIRTKLNLKSLKFGFKGLYEGWNRKK